MDSGFPSRASPEPEPVHVVAAGPPHGFLAPELGEGPKLHGCCGTRETEFSRDVVVNVLNFFISV